MTITKNQLIRMYQQDRVKTFIKTERFYMFPWWPQLDMTGITVSAENIANGSPKAGDCIMIDQDDPMIQTLISKEAMSTTYREVKDKSNQ